MINIGILGNGTVGSGVLELIEKNIKKIKETTGEVVSVKKVLVRDMFKNLRKLKTDLFTDNIEEIFNEDLDIVVEVMGGIDPTYDYVKKLLKLKRHIVTANKDLISKHGEELLNIAKENKVKLYFEASVGGGIPIIKPINECLLGNEIKSIKGILNGTTNFILSKMYEDNISYHGALSIAQKLGFAESNPESDVLGYDAARKLAILSTTAYNKRIDWEKIKTVGINEIDQVDINIAKEVGCKIKLIAVSEKNGEEIYASVRPVLVKSESQFGKIEDEYNGIMINGDAVGEVFFYGKGAGKLPTASAVLGDIIDVIQSKNKNTRSNCLTKGKITVQWAHKNSWMLRIKSSDKSKALVIINNIFKKHYKLNKGNINSEDVVIFVQSENENKLNVKIKELEDFREIISVKSILKLDDIL
ncbi:homoserine dehydrogenase [Clostridium rectalis]|uniref:homoserine dehydrogenase n=1 Tax=Clostridium rectalis TaxID=2040295 RepID=UPI000F633390|nr:homoserine dehydrogenase [Clostridium rectalis]